MLVQKASKPNWILFIAGYFAISMQAKASCCIPPNDGNVSTARTMASSYGAIYQNSVCGLAITTKDGEGAAASGCLVRTLDEKYATIITAGHSFYNPSDGKARDIVSVRITFDGTIDFTSPIKPSETHIRRGFKMGSIANDIAVLKTPHDQIPDSCTPFELYAGTQLYDKPLTHAFHCGYSHFRTTRTLCDTGPVKLYGGHTRVTYTSVEGNPCFATYLASPYKTYEDILSHPGREDDFDPSITAETGAEEGVAREILIKSGRLRMYAPHPQQSIMGPGGSGGPLLVGKGDKFRLAGICHGTNISSEPRLRLPEGNLGLSVYYTPLKDHINWIYSADSTQPAEKTYDFFDTSDVFRHDDE